MNCEQQLEKIFKISEEILNKLNNLDERVTFIEKKIEISLLKSSKSTENLKELKKEDIIIDKVDVLKALKYRDYRSVVYIFRQYYKNKINENCVYPVKITGTRKFEYYDNNKWNPDLYGNFSRDIICMNMQNLFIKCNNLDQVGYEDFILNQDFIYKLSKEKYIKEIFKYIIEEIRLNNI